MTPQETELLQHLGISLIDGLAWLVTLTTLYGVFMLLFSISTGMIMQVGSFLELIHPSNDRLADVEASKVFRNASCPTILVRFGLINNPDLPLEEKPAIVNDKTFTPNIIIVWTSELLPIISDAVVIWRAWVICTGQLWLMTVPIVLWIGTVASSLAYLGLTTSPEGMLATGNDSLSLNIANLLSASIALSMATNAVATMLIGYKLLYIVTLILSLSPNSYSGPGSAQYITAQIFFASYTEISAMYPTVVIVLVNIQRSFVDNFGMNSVVDVRGEDDRHGDTRPATFGHLSFAVDGLQSTTSAGTSEAASNIAYGGQRDNYTEKNNVV
ncbi:hypothetical protein DXG01_016225 [Tephrocybe rancida]|nr:hypothetical protein DXG01_016225 [Tephrocybe rancida]